VRAKEYFDVPSSSSDAMHTVSKHVDDSFQCSCIGWTRHVPRRDCKHILWVKQYGPMPIEPLLYELAREEERRKRKREAIAA
jgi:hypothetical protein